MRPSEPRKVEPTIAATWLAQAALLMLRQPVRFGLLYAFVMSSTLALSRESQTIWLPALSVLYAAIYVAALAAAVVIGERDSGRRRAGVGGALRRAASLLPQFALVALFNLGIAAGSLAHHWAGLIAGNASVLCGVVLGLHALWGLTSIPLMMIQDLSLRRAQACHDDGELGLNPLPILAVFLFIIAACTLAFLLSPSGFVPSLLWPYLGALSYVIYRDIYDPRPLATAPALGLPHEAQQTGT